MNRAAIQELVRSDIRRFLSSRVAVFWSVAFPLLLLLLFTQLFGRPAAVMGDARVQFVDHDLSERSAEVVRIITYALNSTGVQPERVTSAAACTPSILCIEVNSGFGRALDAGGRSTVQVHAGSESATQSSIVLSIVRSVVDRAIIARRVAGEHPDVRMMGEGRMEARAGASYYATGLLTMSILITALMGFAVPIVQMRESGLFDIYQIMPMSKPTFLCSFIASRLIIMLGMTFVFVAVAVGLLGVAVNGGFLKAVSGIGALMVGCVCFIAQGMLVASRLSTVATATVICNALYFLQTFLGDLFIPIGGLPVWLKSVLTSLPARHLCEALRVAVGSSRPVSDIAMHAGILMAWAALFVVLTRFGFVWRRSSGR